MRCLSYILVFILFAMSACHDPSSAQARSHFKSSDSIVHAEWDPLQPGFLLVTCRDGSHETVATGLLLAACEPAPSQRYKKIVSDYEGLFCAIGSDNRLRCHSFASEAFTSAEEILADLGPVKDFAMSDKLRCALLENNSVQCWGESLQGALESLEAAQADAHDKGQTLRARLIAVSNEQICLSAFEDDRLRCFGKDSNTEHPYTILPRKVEQLSGGYAGFCAVYEAGWVNCWGPGHDYMFPRTIEAVATSGNGRIYCVLDHAGVVECSALNEHSLRGQYSVRGSATALAILDNYPQSNVSDTFACVARKNLPALCWGSNANGQTTVPSDLGEVKSFALSQSYACAINQRDGISCWQYGDEKVFEFPLTSSSQTATATATATATTTATEQE